MDWTPEESARERPELDDLATFKYDEYQQYRPGMRFIESLALWLSQFETLAARRAAYNHVRRHLIFLSSDEVSHLVAMAYPDLVRPRLLRMTANDLALPSHLVARLSRTDEFKELQRRTLFLGLSDGAHTDMFRRENPQLTHEQVLQTYEVSPERVSSLLTSLAADLPLLAVPPTFRAVVLLDDFTASGLSYLRKEADIWKGKIGRFHALLTSLPCSQLIGGEPVPVFVVLYAATERACEYLRAVTADLSRTAPGLTYEVLVGQLLPRAAELHPGQNPTLDQLIEAHYDPSLEDRHTWVGGTDLKYGFNACGLSTVLYHNAPNNSLALLVGETDRFKALFPRVRRHAEHE